MALCVDSIGWVAVRYYTCPCVRFFSYRTLRLIQIYRLDGNLYALLSFPAPSWRCPVHVLQLPYEVALGKVVSYFQQP